MFTWLAISIISTIFLTVAISIAVSYYLHLMDLQREVCARDTKSARKGRVEQIFDAAFNNAKTIRVGLFDYSGDRVGDATIECPGTSVRVGDEISVAA